MDQSDLEGTIWSSLILDHTVCMQVKTILLLKSELEDLNLILRERLRWFGHVERSSGAVRTACDILIDGRQGKGGPS